MLHRLGAQAIVPDVLIICAIAQQQRFVSTQKVSGVGQAAVPENDNPAIGTQDAPEFSARGLRIEPVKRLPGHDQVDAVVIESSVYSAALPACEAGPVREQPLG